MGLLKTNPLLEISHSRPAVDQPKATGVAAAKSKVSFKQVRRLSMRGKCKEGVARQEIVERSDLFGMSAKVGNANIEMT